MGFKKVWGFMASNEKIYEYTKAPSEANFWPALISCAVTAAVSFAGSALYDGIKYGYKKVFKKEESAV